MALEGDWWSSPRDLDLGSGQGHISMHNTYGTTSRPNHVTVGVKQYGNMDLWKSCNIDIPWRLKSCDSLLRRKFKNRAPTSSRLGPILTLTLTVTVLLLLLMRDTMSVVTSVNDMCSVGSVCRCDECASTQGACRWSACHVWLHSVMSLSLWWMTWSVCRCDECASTQGTCRWSACHVWLHSVMSL